jgi:hypothetical protein
MSISRIAPRFGVDHGLFGVAPTPKPTPEETYTQRGFSAFGVDGVGKSNNAYTRARIHTRAGARARYLIILFIYSITPKGLKGRQDKALRWSRCLLQDLLQNSKQVKLCQ